MKKNVSIVLASDHAGFLLKDHLLQYLLKDQTLDIKDCGCADALQSVHYPEIVSIACQKIVDQTARFAILICGSGVGVSIGANKYHKNIRAALCREESSAYFAREHNDANVLCLGEWFTGYKMAEKITNIFLQTSFSGGRHQTRVDMLKNL